MLMFNVNIYIKNKTFIINVTSYIYFGFFQTFEDFGRNQNITR